MKCNVGNTDRAIRIIAGFSFNWTCRDKHDWHVGVDWHCSRIDWRISFLSSLSALGYQHQ
jgi:hypothetical protein